ncbi:hypothetical protein [Arthrobacter woluwensis]|uniref:hypothetical protein n=1 Tax=Arthrobacter woluwensis TaxID=156980 RepID=UPI0037FCC4B3
MSSYQEFVAHLAENFAREEEGILDAKVGIESFSKIFRLNASFLFCSESNPLALMTFVEGSLVSRIEKILGEPFAEKNVWFEVVSRASRTGGPTVWPSGRVSWAGTYQQVLGISPGKPVWPGAA